MPVSSLGGCRLVFDMIYRPLETVLLRDAAAAGCQTLNGLDMFVRQAAMQFELWTSRPPDTRGAMAFLADELRTNRAPSP
jgi:shikimate 5-dehydrogenase